MLRNILRAIKKKLRSLFVSLRGTSKSSSRSYRSKSEPKGIILHCTATPKGMDIGVVEIDKWHKARGWKGCGYHEVIRLDGTVEAGRSVEPFETGAHCLGKNDYLGIAWVGGKTENDSINPLQLRALGERCNYYTKRFSFGVDDIHGHNEFANKDCPQINVDAFKNLLL